MSRKLRIERVGFYHIINRGVERRDIFLCHDDYIKFLEIIDDASRIYNFQIFSYCLMKNHYHLLLKTNDENLSLIMRQINSRYSIYFNKRYKRVGPLWQGRFKSWYVWDEVYLQVLVRYIEYNPVKANITKKIGKHPYAMSSNNVEFLVLNFELLNQIDLDKKFDEKEQEKLDKFCSQKLDIKDDAVHVKKRRLLSEYFEKYKRDEAIFEAVKDGYAQSEIAKYLTLSSVSISKILKIYKQKLTPFQFSQLSKETILQPHHRN